LGRRVAPLFDHETDGRRKAMTARVLYKNFGLPSRDEVLSRVREGRKKALASVEMRFTVSCQVEDGIRELIFDRQPTAQDIIEQIGHDAVVVSIEAQRVPLRERPRMFD
jgi:hypothetical protein